MQLAYNVRNVHRAVGTRLSAHITRRYGMGPVAAGADHCAVARFGRAQSLGAFAVRGLRLEVFGDANDYVGKGLSGGTIVVRPLVSSPIVASENVIIGNTCLYGATSGKLFAAGRAGERFAVRNSGAVTVVEGCGDNGCEYMTGGTTVILGPVGDNFAAGMSGGMAYLYDPHETAPERLNPDMVIHQRIEIDHYADQLRALLTLHAKSTQSRLADAILRDFSREVVRFWQIVPKGDAGQAGHPSASGGPSAHCLSAAGDPAGGTCRPACRDRRLDPRTTGSWSDPRSDGPAWAIVASPATAGGFERTGVRVAFAAHPQARLLRRRQPTPGPGRRRARQTEQLDKMAFA